MKRFGIVLIVLALAVLSVTAIADSNVQSGGIASIGLSSGLQTINYNPFSANMLYGTRAIYETLMNVNILAGTTEPWLAASYEWKDNNLELVFNLRKGVEWSDGTPFTSKDVVFTFDMLKKFPAMDLTGIWNGSLESVSADGPYAVTFKFSEPNVPKLMFIETAFIVPEHIWASIKDPVTFTNPNPVGTGPFVFESFDSALAIETYRKNPNYWQKGKPYIDGYKITNFKANDANILATIKGEVDWASSFMPDVQKLFIDKAPDVNKAWISNGAMVCLYPNDAKYPFDTKEFRLALALAINKEKVAKLGEYGYTPPANPTGLRIPLMKEWFDTSLEPLVYSYDPQKAVKILESMGFKKNSAGYFVNPQTGKPFTFNIMVVSGWSDWVSSASVIAGDLKAIGLDVNVQQVSYGQYASSLAMGYFDLTFNGPSANMSPYYAYNSVLSGKNTAPIGQSAASNYSRWNDSVTNAMLKLFETTSDATVQKRAMAVIERIMLTDVPVIPLFYTPTVELYTTRHFVGWPSDSDMYNAGAPWLPGVVETTLLNIRSK